MVIEEHMNPAATPRFRSLVPWLVLLALCILAQWLGWEQQLRFDRDAIGSGRLWLLLSAHLVHLNWNHLWLNMGGLLLVAVFFRAYGSVLVWLGVLLLSAAGVGLGLYFLDPQMHYYVGLSGVLHGLFLVGAWWERRYHPLSGKLLLLLIVVKLVWEQLFGALPGSASMTGGHVAVDAHLYGALSGLLFLLLHQVVHVDDGQQDGEYDK
jgi:rhomboid family GlyGly-CTERM serine protease